VSSSKSLPIVNGVCGYRQLGFCKFVTQILIDKTHLSVFVCVIFMFLYKFDIPMCFSSKSHDVIVKVEDINDHLTKKLNDNINLCLTI